MKKFLLLLLLPIRLYAQSLDSKAIQPTYVDALKLVELKAAYDKSRQGEGGSAAEVVKEIRVIILRYGSFSEVTDNPTLNELWNLPLDNANISEGGSSSVGGSVSIPELKFSATGSQSFGWQESAINGLSSFMAGRFRQEVIHYGLKNVFSTINTRDTALFRSLMPETFSEIRKLQQPDVNVYYSADLVFLREIIQSDLKNLKDRIPEHTLTIFPKAADLPLGEDILKVAGQLYLSSSKGVSLPETFYQLTEVDYKERDVRNAIYMNYVFSEALRDTVGSKRLWIDLNKLNGSMNDGQPLVKYFFGLLSLQLKSIGLGNENMEQIRKIMSYYADLNATEQYLKSLNYQLNNEQGFYLIHLLNTAMSKYMSSLDKIGIYFSEETVALIGKMERVMIPFAENKYQQGVVALLKEMGPYLASSNNETYKRTLIFAVQLAETKTSEDMEDLLQAYALPIGGSSIKRGSNFNLSLNGYVGLTAGPEKALGNVTQTRTNIGLAAPIGISGTFGGRVTVFASIIDLGSIVNLRLNNDTTSFSGVRFEHFISPGIGLYYNLKNSPITIGGHFSYIANLRNIAYESNTVRVTETNVPVTRLNLSFLVDIPFFTFYNRTAR